jgi:hypothetical protein
MEFILNIMDWINNLGPDWVDAVAKLVAGATAITMLTPTKTDNKVIDVILKVLNFVAGNILKNKNEDA